MEVAEYEKMYELEGGYWWWVGRRRLLDVILDRLGLRSASVLDVGCGTGFNLNWLCKYGSVVGLDFSKDALRFCGMRGNRNVVLADAESLSFKDNTFDLVTALDLLEHVDDQEALKEIHQVLKPNGHLVLSVPAFNFMWSKHDEAARHVRRYRKRQLKAAVEANGFVVEKMSFWNSFLFIPIAAVRLARKRWRERQVVTDVRVLPGIVNGLLAFVLRFEAHLMKRANLPIGVSLVCVARAHK